MTKRLARRAVPLGDTDPFAPSAEQPVRSRSRTLGHDTQFEPHWHPWAQLAYCASGLLQVTVSTPARGAETGAGRETTAIVPPWRAVWIPPGARHAVSMLEASQLHTLYVDPSVVPAHRHGARVLVVSPLLRELVLALDRPHLAGAAASRQALSTLLLAELENASTEALGVPMPDAQRGDRRLRALCEAVLDAPAHCGTLAAWAVQVGASERTLARLFREELGTSFQRWRQQVVLAHALPMLARGSSVAQVAAASGYATDSAFSAMFKSALGQPPTRYRARRPTVA